MPKHKLTDMFIRNLTPPEKTTIWWDEVQPSLGVRVTPTGAKSWKVAYRHKGRLRWFTIDKFPAVGLKDARDIAGKIRAQAALGADPQGSKMAARQGETLKDVAARYVEQHAMKHNKSWRQAKALMDTYVIPKLGNRRMGDIVRRDIRVIFDDLTHGRGKPVLANQILSAVSAVLTWAAEREIVAANVARGIRRNPTKAAERHLSDKEIAAVWPAFEELGLLGCTALRLVLLTAQRPGEVTAMRWQDVNLEAGVWTLPGDPEGDWPGTKNGRTHEVPLSDMAVELLTELDPKAQGALFAGRAGRPIAIPQTKAIWTGLDIARFRPHDLRATAATGMDRLHIPKEHISRVLNHVEAGVTASYIRHEALEQKRRALDTWANYVQQIIEGKTAENVVSLQ